MTLFGLTPSDNMKRFGVEKGREARKFMEESVDYLAEFIRKKNVDCEYEGSGYLLVATNEAQVKRLREEFKAAETMDYDGIETWDEKKLREEFNTDKYLLGWFESRCGILNPARWARELKRLVEENDARIYEYSPVMKIKREVGDRYKYVLKTPNGVLRAKRVVFATNAYSILFPMIYKYQTPAFTRIVMTEPLTDEQMESIGWGNRAGIEDARNFIHYYRLTKDNRIVLGGGDVGVTYGRNMEKDQDRKNFEHLKNYLFWVFPQLKRIRFTHEWGGPVSITLDMAPAIGYIGGEKTMIYALGYIGHGVSATFNAGRTVAELLLNIETHRTNLFIIEREMSTWPPEPLRYILSIIIRGYMKLGDKLKYGER
jgi:glycine/D-amino acid oxidase-like deaminating enzyme